MVGRILLVVLLFGTTPAAASTSDTLVSNSLFGTPGNGASLTPAVSGDGRYIAFPSTASNLVRHDKNEVSDVFVKDTVARKVVRVSVSSDGHEGNGASYDPPALSSDGLVVAFLSSATNLVSPDTNEADDVFVKNLRTGAVTLASSAADGTPGNGPSYGSPAVSSDGRYIAFRSDASNLVPSDTNNVADVFVKDVVTGAVDRVSAADRQGDRLALHGVAISADGRYVAFPSAATNLVPGDTNGSIDIFVKDRQTGSIVRANTTADGTQTTSYTLMPSITADGRTVAFVAWGDNLVAGDTEDTPDLFVKDLTTGAITRVNTASDGTVAESQPYGAVISGNRRYVAFSSLAANLVPGDTNNVDDVFVKDLLTGTTSRIPGRPQGNNFTVAPALSSDGQVVAFSSYANNFVTWDRNGSADVFVRPVDRP